MTDNQRKAIDELTKYQEAKKDIRHHKQQLEKLETKVQRSTRSCDSIMRETWRDGRFVAVPVVVQTSPGCNAVEELMDSLMDQRAHYIAKQAIAERICMTIEINISKRCDGIHARVLRSFYLHNHRLEKIAMDENLSYPHVKRVRRNALELYGEKMIPRDPAT